MRASKVLFVITVATLQLAAQGPSSDSAVASQSLRIQYTGRLFGYYRMEPGETQALPPVREFLNSRSKGTPDEQKRPLLLGMGDNFAPEMGASLQLVHSATCEPPVNPKLDPPESVYKSSDRNALRAECDNVVNFLLTAGYRAIVPGREDFGYSTPWLHKIGIFIRQSYSSHNREGKLTILAANIRIAFESGSLSGKCPLLFSDNLSSNVNETCSDNVPTRLDWLDRLSRIIPTKTGVREQVENEAKDKFGSYTLLGNEALAMESMLPPTPVWLAFRKSLSALYKNDYKVRTLKPDSYETEHDYQEQLRLTAITALMLVQVLKRESPLSDEEAENVTATDFRSAVGKLSSACVDIHNSVAKQRPETLPDVLWEDEVCTYGKAMLSEHEVDMRKRRVASPLSPEALAAARNALLRAIFAEQKDIGFTEAKIIENGHEKSVLIIGVAGQETMKAISLTDSRICLQKPEGDFGPGSETIVSCRTAGSAVGKIDVLNPTGTIRAILLASDLVHGKYDYRILMAQMPRTQAIELAARLDAPSGDAVPGVEMVSGSDGGKAIPQLDLVLSEAQFGHASANLKMQYSQYLACPRSKCYEDVYRWSTTPVLTPVPAYDIYLEQLVRPDTSVFLETEQTQEVTRNVCNAVADRSDWSCNPKAERTVWPQLPSHHSALDLLMEAVARANFSTRFVALGGGTLNAADCMPDSGPLEDCNVSVIQFLLKSMQEQVGSDIAMLQRRDIFLGRLPDGYDDYKACESAKYPTGCQLRMALDRVLWKGDYSEKVMLSGKDIATMMSSASSQNTQEQSLQQTDISGQWLVTFGIVTYRPSNLTRSKPSSNEFFVTHDPSCNDVQEREHPSAGGTALYCVNGLPLLADHAYSVATTDYLNQNFVPKQPDDYYSRSSKFVTETLEARILNRGGRASTTPSQNHGQLSSSSQKVEIDYQQRDLFQLQIAKVVTGYSFRASPRGDNFIASAFQGATDARAGSPSQSEFDIEAKERGIWRMKYFNLGIQSDSAYDRSVQGNLTGSPVNAAYPLDNATVGGFGEWKITSRGKHPQGPPAGILKLVVAPYQYQRQFNGNYLFFAHTDKTKDEQRLHLPPVNGFSHRAGLRWWEEVSSGKWFRGDRGSYFEGGFQIAVLNDILSAVTLVTPTTAPLTCPANGSVTILNCFKSANYPITAGTTAAEQHMTLHSPGFYWDVHFQKALFTLQDKSGPGASLIIDSKGDSFLPRNATKTLSTQTLYDAPVSVTLAFPFLRNFSLGPTYQAFFFGNQLAAQHLFVNSFGFTARWYYDRDAVVGLSRQGRFKGPASADETKTARIK